MIKDNSFHFTPIGFVHSVYKEKFGIPRQSGLVSSPASIEMISRYSSDEAFRELETFSHIWIIFIFHQAIKDEWSPTVRPPRLGGNKRIGVFASRSMFRPNPVGLSVVELKNIERKGNNIILNIVGGDFLDGTPVIDIKPYVPYADAIENAKAGYANVKPGSRFDVRFSDEALIQLQQSDNVYPGLKNVITEILQLDPRPAYQDRQPVKTEYAMKLYEFDVKWRIDNEQILVVSLLPLQTLINEE